MSRDFNVEIEENFEIDDEGELPVEQERILKSFNKRIVNKGFNDELSKANYIYYNNNYFKLYSKNKKEELGEKHKNFEELLLKSFKNIIDDYFNNFKYESLSNELIKELGLSKEDIELIMIKDKNKVIKSSKINEPIKFVSSFKNIIYSLNEFEPNNEYIKSLEEEFKNTLLYMDKEKKN